VARASHVKHHERQRVFSLVLHGFRAFCGDQAAARAGLGWRADGGGLVRHRALILLSFQRWLSLYQRPNPHIGERKSGEKRRNIALFLNIFFFFLRLDPVQTPHPPPVDRGPVVGVASASPTRCHFLVWGPYLWGYFAAGARYGCG